jgi:serine/threonine protein kinase
MIVFSQTDVSKHLKESDMINTTIGKYKIIRLIGEGGMACVYEAEHEMLGTKVAIKVLNPILSANAQIKERFRNEAKIMASLDHPNITKVIDFDEQPQQLSIIMEFLNGEDLDQKIKRNGPSSEKEIIDYFSQTLSAFQYAHEKGIVHRDIKPSNIFILPNGHVKILDFGIAKLFGQGNEMTQTGTQMGTPIYMSPEQVKADKYIDHRSDIYSLGVTMFFAMTGKPPYNSNTDSQFDIFNKIVFEPLPELPVIGNFDDFVKKACQKDREQRFQSCEEFILCLNEDNEVSPNKTQEPIQEKVETVKPKVVIEESSSNLTNKRIIWISLTLVFVVVIFLLYNNRALPINSGPRITTKNIVKNTNDEPLNIRLKACSEMPPSYGISYSADNTIDKDISTWWSPMKSLGTEVSIGFTFNQFKTMKGISIHGGSHFPNFKNLGDLYWLNLRIRRARVVFSNGYEEIITLKDLDYQQNVYFNKPVKCNSFMLELLDYYPSKKWKDYCISELEPIF